MAEDPTAGAPINTQRRRVRRNALLFGLLAFGIYASFIVYAVLHGRT
jgi:hypothetical protein